MPIGSRKKSLLFTTGYLNDWRYNIYLPSLFRNSGIKKNIPWVFSRGGFEQQQCIPPPSPPCKLLAGTTILKKLSLNHRQWGGGRGVGRHNGHHADYRAGDSGTMR